MGVMMHTRQVYVYVHHMHNLQRGSCSAGSSWTCRSCGTQSPASSFSRQPSKVPSAREMNTEMKPVALRRSKLQCVQQAVGLLMTNASQGVHTVGARTSGLQHGLTSSAMLKTCYCILRILNIAVHATCRLLDWSTHIEK